MRRKSTRWLLSASLAFSGCIGQDTWTRWNSAIAYPGLAPMHRVYLMVGERRYTSRAQLDEYSSHIVKSLHDRRIIVLNDEEDNGLDYEEHHQRYQSLHDPADNEGMDAKVVVYPFRSFTGSSRSGGVRSFAGIEIRIERAIDGHLLFSGRFSGGPAKAGDTIADLVALGNVDESLIGSYRRPKRGTT